MSPFLRFIAFLLALGPVLLATGCAPAADDRGPVVLAASSMQDAMEQIADLWEEEGHPRPLLSFAASSALARQVDSGAPADLFISADMEWMDWLDERGLIARDSRTVIATNDLVLVGGGDPASGPGDGDIGALLAGVGDGQIAMGDPDAVPAGRYGRAALESLGLWQAVESRVVPAENVRAALALAERGESAFAIVYRTDALASDLVRVLAVFPARSHPPIEYPAALLGESRNAQAAGFLAFLTGPEGRAILAASGFGPPS